MLICDILLFFRMKDDDDDEKRVGNTVSNAKVIFFSTLRKYFAENTLIFLK